MTTVSALATTLFLGGWHAPWPINMWDGANTGWWPLLWFIAKVWAFLFFFIWLRATLPRLRYDQFMALGWKVLIPISLVWITIVATTHSLRTHGYTAWADGLITVGTVLGAQLSPSRCGGSLRRAGPFAEIPLQAADTAPSRYRRCPGNAHSERITADRRSSMPKFLDADRRFRGHVRDHVQEADHRGVSGEARTGRQALPRPSPAQPLPRRAGEVHRLRAVRLGLPGRRDLRRGRDNTAERTLLARRALRAGVPDQLSAVHRLRAVHRGLPHPRADDDQRLRDGRRQPRRPDLRQGQAARTAAARNGGAAAPDGSRAAPTRTTTAATSRTDWRRPR